MSDVLRTPGGPRRIALLMPRADVHTRGIFRGIARYARPFRPWNFHLGLPRLDALDYLRRWRAAGIIATVRDAELERRVARLGVPLVNCSSDLAGGEIDRVVTDNRGVGRLAAEHFFERGHRRLAYCGEPRGLAGDERFEGFRGRAERDGVEVVRFINRRGTAMTDEAGWSASSGDPELQRWIAGLPKPVGLLACHDPMAMLLSQVCQEIGVRVPDEVAILGVDNDAMLCEMAYPSLSSVHTPQEQIGFEAARRLDELMRGQDPTPRTRTLPPLGVVTRQSTDALAADDAVVARAMRFIQEHAHEPIRVADVVAPAGCSRRSLESRFKEAAGRSILDAIQHAHVTLATQLLRGGTLTLDEVAAASGFNSRERFSRVFRQVTGQTPRSLYPRQSATSSST